MLSGYIISFLLLSNEMIGAFMPGVTVNQYGQMVVDVNKVRAAIVQVIPPNTIENEARYKKVSNEMDVVIRAIQDYNDVYVRKGKEIVHLYMSHGSKAEDFQRVFSEMDAGKEEGQKKIIEARFKMKEVMTPQEWKALFSPQG